MTLKELKEIIASEPPENDSLEVAVWLPGSQIDLRYVKAATLIRRGDTLLFEGNVKPGSALDF